MIGWRRTVGIVAVALWIATTIDVMRRWQELAVGDFETYWAGARRLLDGLPLYPASQLSQPFILGDAAFGRGYVYPPTAAWLATPLALLPMPVAFSLFTATSALALGGVSYLIACGAGMERSRAVTIAALVVGTGPGLDALLTGNANALVAAGLGAMWLRPRASGFLAAIGALIKVYPIVGLAWTIRRRAPLIKPVLSGAAAAGASLSVGGMGPWKDFGATMANGMSTEYFVIESPRSLLSGPLGVTGAGLVAGIVTAALLGAVLRARDDETAIAMLGIAMILPAPDWHLHYFIVPVIGILPLALRPIAMRAGAPSQDARTTFPVRGSSAGAGS